MKTLFCIVVWLSMLAVPSYAQDGQVKKIAVLEVVDKDNTVPSGIKLMVRSKICALITATPGYEGYDRADVGSILGEHLFQRTGLINDSQIKKIGEMTAAECVLVTEVTKLGSRVLITAKIMNVETAVIESSASVVASTDIDVISGACSELAAKLLGVQHGRTIVL